MRQRTISHFQGLHTAGLGRGKASLNTLLEAENVRVHSGSAVPRNGQEVLFDSIVDDNGNPLSNDINCIYEYIREYFDSNDDTVKFYKEFIFNIGTTLYGWEEGAANVWEINTNVNRFAVNEFWMAVYRDWAYISDGVGTMQRYDAANYVGFILTRPVFLEGEIALSGTAGKSQRIGFKKYKYRYVQEVSHTALRIDNFTASPFSDEQISPDLNQHSLAVTLKASSQSQVTGIELYTTKVFPSIPELDGAIWYLLAELDNVNQVYDDNLINDAYWQKDVNATEPDLDSRLEVFNYPALDDTDWVKPEDGLRYLVVYKERLYAVPNQDPSLLVYSEIGEPTKWPVLNYIQVKPDDGDVITGIVIRGGALFIFKKRSIWILTGDPEANPLLQIAVGGDGSPNQTGFELGCTAPRSIATHDTKSIIFYSSTHGVYALFGGELVHLSKEVDGIQGLPDTTAGSTYIDDEDEAYYVLSPPTGLAWVCHLATRQWTNDTNVNAPCFCVDSTGRLLGGSGTRLNEFYKEGTTDDNGVAFVPKIKTAWVNLRNANVHAVLRGVGVQSEDITLTTNPLRVYNQDGLQETTVFGQTVEPVGISGIAGRLFSTALEWTSGTVESLTLYFTSRKGHDA